MQGMVVIVPDKTKADELISVGFKCTSRTISEGKIIYQFMKSPELERYLISNFSKQDFFINKNLTF